MESMILMESDQTSKMNPSRSLSSVGNNYMSGGGGGFQLNNPSLPFASVSYLSRLFSDAGMATYGSYYQHPHQLYSSLNSAFPYHSSSLHQPPLLPLPFSASANGHTLPPTTKKMAAISKNNNMMTMIKKKKKKAAKATCIKPIKELPEKKKATAVVNSEEEETGEEFFLSPPPSSLPLPKLLLTARPKATNDVCRLLRI